MGSFNSIFDILQRNVWAITFRIKLIKRIVIWSIQKPRFAMMYLKFQCAVRKNNWTQSRYFLRQIYFLKKDLPARLYVELSEAADRLGEVELSVGFLESQMKISPHSQVDWGKITDTTSLLVDLSSTEKQGIAHALMAFGFVKKASSLFPNLVVRANSRVVVLLRQSLDNIHVIDQFETSLVVFQAKANLNDLRLFYGKTFIDTLSLRYPLSVDKSLVIKLRERYSKYGKPIIGISWYSPHGAKQLPPLNEWSSFLSKIDAIFVSLQFNPASDQLRELEKKSRKKVILDDEIDQSKDLDFFAAQVKSMDMVVSIGNTTAHMGGAVGTPTYVIRDDTFRWFWPVDEEESIWYSSIRVIPKQRKSWSFVFDRLEKEINKFFYNTE